MSSVEINIVGDFCVKQLQNHYFGPLLTKRLQGADLNVINLESPVKQSSDKPIKKSGPCHYQDVGIPVFLEKNGFNVIAMANNHIMDYGVQALQNTCKMFSNSIKIGVGSYEDAYKVRVIEINGTKIGFLNITQYEFGVLAERMDSTELLGAAWLCHPCIDELIIDSKKKCDFLVVIPHAGLENFEFPLPEIRTLYRHFISMGADAVVGGHPHIIQCWELYNNKPIVYSLGNFCFDSIGKKESWYQGLIVSLNIKETISFKIDTIVYDPKKQCVEIDNNNSVLSSLSIRNKTFINDKKYISIINEKCLELERYYLSLFENSGFYRPTIYKYSRLVLGMIKTAVCFKKRKVFDDTHFINNIRCETHRWILSRIYEIKANNFIN